MPVIPVSNLQPGMFISLEKLGWMDHPFVLNRFRIADMSQIQTLHRMGLATVEWDPERSSSRPLQESAPLESDEDLASGALKALLADKQDRVLRVREKRESLARCARLFEQESGSIRQILGELGPRPNDAYSQGRVLVHRLVGGLIKASSVAVHLVNLKKSESGLPNHAMNVMVLSLLIGKTIGLDEEAMRELGLGAMLHDAGLGDIPSRVVRNPNRTVAEEQLYRTHIGRGLNAVAAMKNLPSGVKLVIACHHEHWDGTGYPNGVADVKVPRLARIVALANRYDNICNPLDAKKALRPAEAVAHLYKHEGSRFDPDILGAFIKAVGVYPPGTFILLEDGSYALVIESNSKNLLRPVLMLYDASVPRNEALLLDLAETDMKIEKSLVPDDIPREVVEYLAPQGRVDFYVEGQP